MSDNKPSKALLKAVECSLEFHFQLILILIDEQENDTAKELKKQLNLFKENLKKELAEKSNQLK